MSVLVKSSYHTSVFSNRTITWLMIDVYEQQQFWRKIILEWETDNTCMGFNSHDDVWPPDKYLILMTEISQVCVSFLLQFLASNANWNSLSCELIDIWETHEWCNELCKEPIMKILMIQNLNISKW